jgi:hypothetical protein
MSNRAVNDFNFKATGIGSVPHLDIRKTCENILNLLPDIPFWPQLVNRDPKEDMNIQFSEGLPLLQVDEESRSLVFSSDNKEAELVTFYDHLLTDDLDYFAVSDDYAAGLYEQIGLVGKNPDRYGDYIKGHSVGPLTFSASVIETNGKSALFNPDIFEAFTKGLAIKALWQVRKLESTGKKVILFLDEPYLSGFGSAFSPVQRQEVVDNLKEVVNYIHSHSDALVGIHCCGNTDWSMIIESGPDIVNFDAFAFMEYFLLYPDDISRFIGDNGGTIAWGIVPTSDLTEAETVENLFSKLQTGINRLYEWGLDPELVAGNSILTPACGMGSMDPSLSDRVLNLLSGLSGKCGDLV